MNSELEALGANVSGKVYTVHEPDMLTQDMLEVELPNGVFIDVGWYPEHDLGGHYVILVFKDDVDNQLVEPIETKEYLDVVSAVMRHAYQNTDLVANTSGSVNCAINVGNIVYA